MSAWTVLQAIVVEAETQDEADRKAFAWYEAASFDGLIAHRMCGHPIEGDVLGCPCHVSNRSAEGTYGLIQNVPIQ